MAIKFNELFLRLPLGNKWWREGPVNGHCIWAGVSPVRNTRNVVLDTIFYWKLWVSVSVSVSVSVAFSVSVSVAFSVSVSEIKDTFWRRYIGWEKYDLWWNCANYVYWDIKKGEKKGFVWNESELCFYLSLMLKFRLFALTLVRMALIY